MRQTPAWDEEQQRGVFLALAPSSGVEFTRHARNGMRLYGLSEVDVARLVAEPLIEDADPAGRRRFTGLIRGVRIRVVLALEDPDLVVTVHARRR